MVAVSKECAYDFMARTSSWKLLFRARRDMTYRVDSLSELNQRWTLACEDAQQARFWHERFCLYYLLQDTLCPKERYPAKSWMAMYQALEEVKAGCHEELAQHHLPYQESQCMDIFMLLANNILACKPIWDKVVEEMRIFLETETLQETLPQKEEVKSKGKI